MFKKLIERIMIQFHNTEVMKVTLTRDIYIKGKGILWFSRTPKGFYRELTEKDIKLVGKNIFVKSILGCPYEIPCKHCNSFYDVKEMIENNGLRNFDAYARKYKKKSGR